MEELQLTGSIKKAFKIWHGKYNYEYTPSNQQYVNISILMFTDIPTILTVLCYCIFLLNVQCINYMTMYWIQLYMQNSWNIWKNFLILFVISKIK